VALAFVALPACAPLPPSDPSVSVRESSSDTESEADTDAADPAPAAAKASGPLTWVTSETDGLAQSKAERRPMLVHFAAEWCSVCRRMAQETFGDPRVKKQAGRFVAVRIDATNDDDPQVSAALSKYAVLGVPTLILFDSSGHEQRRFTDFIRPDTLLGEIAQVR
jgi:thiol:disulfide interchange protein DsbD